MSGDDTKHGNESAVIDSPFQKFLYTKPREASGHSCPHATKNPALTREVWLHGEVKMRQEHREESLDGAYEKQKTENTGYFLFENLAEFTHSSQNKENEWFIDNNYFARKFSFLRIKSQLEFRHTSEFSSSIW